GKPSTARYPEDQLQQPQDGRTTDSLCHHLQQLVMLDVVKVGSQVEVDHPRLAEDNRLCYPSHCLVRRPFGAVPVRARLEVGLEDRLENEFDGPLHHTVPNRRNLEHSLSATALRYGVLTGRQWTITSGDQFVSQPRQERLHPCRFDGLERHAVTSRRSTVRFSHRISFVERF